MRPLRDRAGAQTTVVIETRTAAQATREATLRYPDMKVITVTRVTPTVADLKAAKRTPPVSAAVAAAPAPKAAPRSDDRVFDLDVSGAIVPLRRVGGR